MTEYSDINMLCDQSPGAASRVRNLRTENIEKGLPSIAVATVGKAGTISVASIFNCGFELPSFAYSLIDLEVIESWARDFTRGGACYTTHLRPTPQNIARLRRSGVNKVIAHVRDPRQALLSLAHHIIRYPGEYPLDAIRFGDKSVAERVEMILPYYLRMIHWIEGWIEAGKELQVLLSTFEGFVQHKDEFIERYLRFYGGPREYFSYEKATQFQPNVDYHFRSGQLDEWREVLPDRLVQRLSAWLPEELKQRFNWVQ